MKTKTKSDAVSGSNATEPCIISAGETFAGGAMIDLVSGSPGSNKPELLLWNGKKATVGIRVENDGSWYESAELAQSLYRAITLPSHCHDYGSVRGLFDSIGNLFSQHLGLPERESNLLACFSISTWLTDRLPTAPNLTISGPDQELGIDLLHLLSCVCRHSLMLAEVTPAGFRSLPMQLSLTLLLNQQNLKPNMQRLFRASSYRGLHLPGSRGSVVDLYGPKAIFCGDDTALDGLGSGVIHISAVPSRSQRSTMDGWIQEKIANEFQPRLLMYRLKNFGKVCESVDVSKFTPATRSLARSLAASFPGDSELSRKTVELLRPQDEEARSQRSCDVNYAIVEILLATVHDQKRKAVRVDELAQQVNALLQSRGETLIYSAMEIGWKLRGLNIPRHTSSSGREVSLGRAASQSLHLLARNYEVQLLRAANCRDCGQEESIISKRLM